MASSLIEPIFTDEDDAAEYGFEMPREKRQGPVVVAIDIGTTFSGYALSFTSDKYAVFAMKSSDSSGSRGGRQSTKVPTTLLLKPDGSFHSFGHQALVHYNRELDESEQKEWLYFERFKMKLHSQKKLTRETPVSAANGRELPVGKIFAHALRHFRNTALAECKVYGGAELKVTDVRWVVTVPAIWDGGAKQTMREAAYEAGLASKKRPEAVQIALEPESASIYCKSIKRIGRSSDDTQYVSEAFMEGSTYLLADLGGGTADVTVHEVSSTGKMKERHHATGGAWGGTYVDQSFVRLLESIFTKEWIRSYREENPGDWVDLMTVKFETSKRLASLNSTMYVEFPHSFHDFVRENGSSIQSRISSAKNPNLKFSRGSLAMKYAEVRKLFNSVLDNIVFHLKSIIAKVGGVNYIILVGGFATSQLLQTRIREEFEKSLKLRVIIPPESSLAVVMGAVLFGHDPTQISSRRCRYSYGTDYIDTGSAERDWKFQTYVKKNQEIGLNDKVTHTFYPIYAEQTTCKFGVYESDSENPVMINEPDVREVASFVLPMPDTRKGLDRKIFTTMLFGLTEIAVESLDETSGKQIGGNVQLDFLS